MTQTIGSKTFKSAVFSKHGFVQILKVRTLDALGVADGVGPIVGALVGPLDGALVGLLVGAVVGAAVGGMIDPGLAKFTWKYLPIPPCVVDAANDLPGRPTAHAISTGADIEPN